MKKTAAMQKLALAVREYIAAEQDYMKVAQTIQQYQMQKTARPGIMQGIKGMLGMKPPAPAGMSGNTKALLAALGVGGAAALAPHAATALGNASSPAPAELGAPDGGGMGLGTLMKAFPGLADAFGGAASGISGAAGDAMSGLKERLAGLGSTDIHDVRGLIGADDPDLLSSLPSNDPALMEVLKDYAGKIRGMAQFTHNQM